MRNLRYPIATYSILIIVLGASVFSTAASLPKSSESSPAMVNSNIAQVLS